MTARRVAAALGALAGLLPAAGLAVAAFSGSVAVDGSFSAAPSFSPIPRSVPDVLGAPRQGATLTMGDAAWHPSLGATSSTYVWRRCDTAGAGCIDVGLPSATPASYTVLAADAAAQATFRVRVVGTRGSAPGVTVDSPVSTPALDNGTVLNTRPTASTPLPSISGTTAVGQTLTAVPGTWLNASATFTYAWLRCDGVGTGCTQTGIGGTYVLTSADRSARMRLRVTAHNAIDPTQTATATTPDTSVVD